MNKLYDSSAPHRARQRAECQRAERLGKMNVKREVTRELKKGSKTTEKRNSRGFPIGRSW